MYPPVCAHSLSHLVALFVRLAAYIIEKGVRQALINYNAKEVITVWQERRIQEIG
jgi:hypothetical protein